MRRRAPGLRRTPPPGRAAGAPGTRALANLPEQLRRQAARHAPLFGCVSIVSRNRVQALSAPAHTCVAWRRPQVRRAGALREVESVHARRGRHAGIDAGPCCCAGHGRRDKCGTVCPSMCLPTLAWAAQQLGVHRARPAATWCSVGVSTGCAQRKFCRVAAALRVSCVHALALLGVDARSRSQEPLHTFNHIKYPIIHPLCAAGRQEFVAGLDGLPEEAKAALAALTPATYVGNAAAQARAVRGHL